MPGLPSGFSIEMYLGGSWVDVTPWLKGEAGVSVHQGRSTEYSDVGTGTLNFQLRNEDGRFTPRSPVSPYFPDLVSGAPVRATVTPSTTSFPVFRGKVTKFDPKWPNRGLLAGGYVEVACVDALAELERTTLEDRWTEEARAAARAGATWVDIPELSAESTATGLDNLGVTTTGGALGTAAIVRGSGGVSFDDPSGVIMQHSAKFSASGGLGSSITLTPQGAAQGVDFWISVDDSNLSAYQCAFVAGAGVGSIWLEPNGGPGLNLTVRTGTTTTTHTLVVNVQDATWRHLRLRPNAATPATTDVTVTTAAGVSTVVVPWDMRSTGALCWGAQDASGSYAATCAVAGILAFGSPLFLPSAYGLIGQTAAASAQFAALQRFVPQVASWAVSGVEDRTIGEPAWAGKTAAAVLQQIARTVNGVGWCPPGGAVTLVMADVARPATPGYTFPASDLDAGSEPPSFSDAAATQPTRVKILYSGGSVTAIDSDAEASRGQRVQAPDIDTCAMDQVSALFAGDYVIKGNVALRISAVAVDLYSTATDLWAAFLTAFPSQLFAITGWPAQMTGDDTVRVHVEGWDLRIVESDSEGGWTYTIDCAPADLFPSFVWDGGDDWGRWSWGSAATVTGGTALGTTGVGTAAITFTGGFGLTTDPADYPLYLDWDGEVVRIDTPPGGTTSPQTVTIAARAQQLTAAQVHVAGEAVDLYKPATWGF